MKGTSMGNGEAANPTKSDKAPDKASSSLKEQPNMIPYPDWATLQTYYAPGVSLPPPYMAAASCRAPPPYMWGAQPFMPPYGAPYPPYPHGVYGHPSVPLGAHSQSKAIVPIPSITEAVVTTPISTEPLDKSSKDKGKGLLKKLKRLHGLPVANGSRNAGSAPGKAVQGKSQSDESTEEDSSTASDESSEPREDNKTRNRSSEDYPNTGKDEKAVRSKIALALINSAAGKSVVTVPSTSQVPRIESKVTTNGEVTTNAAPLPRANRVPIEIRKQEDGILKREKRKQSNRESARRSRMRKQAETEELAMRADTLGAENTSLKTEITLIMENSKKLKMENIALMDVLKKTQLIQAGETSSEKVAPAPQTPPTDSTKNFLSKLSETSSFSSGRQETDSADKSKGKRHQRLVASSRADAVAAS